jgi:prepilin-type N-terminal cleavage/methylation domain-containing protein
MSNKKQKGFTIIEVVLVLAIAGLIFLMVFIALPALQAGQRDTARKNDVGIAISAITSYKSNNAGSFPASGVLTATIGKVSTNTTAFALGTVTSGEVAPAVGTITVTNGTKCGTTAGQVNTVTASAGSFTAITKLEGNGGTAFFCQEG